MARPGVTYEEVIAAAASLEKQGEKLSVDRIREILGNRGSLALINRFIKEWKDQTFDLTSETMQQPSNNSNEDLGNHSTNNAEGQSATSGNAIDPQELPQAQQDLLPDEPVPASPEPLKAAPARAPSPFDEPKETYQPERLEDLDDNALIIKIRRLETLLNKEQSRREAAEKMAEEAKEYADIIKEQIGQRVADLKQSMEVMTNQLKAEAREMKHNADSDLKFYREQLQKANVKILSLLTGQAPEPQQAAPANPAPNKDSSGISSE